MISRSVARIGVISLIAGLLGVHYRLQAAQQSSVSTPHPQCVDAQKGDYSPGALIRQGEQLYRCVYVYGKELAPAGVAWLKVMEITPGTIHTIQEPAGQ
jgi:hypothetical protein